MRLVSRVAKKNFLGYRAIEHTMFSVILLAAAPIVVLWIMMRTSRQRDGDSFDQMLALFQENALPLIAAVLVIIALVNLVVWSTRRGPFIVLLELREHDSIIRFGVQGDLPSSYKEVDVPVRELIWQRYEGMEMKLVPAHKGYRFWHNGQVVGLLLADHFTWESQWANVRKGLQEVSDKVPMRS